MGYSAVNQLANQIAQVTLFVLASLLISSCQEDVPSTSKVTVTLRSAEGLVPFPNGTKMLAYERTGTMGTLIDTIYFPAVTGNEDQNVGSFTYTGEFPVKIQLEKLEDPAYPAPLKMSDPWYSSNQRFTFLDAGPKSLQLYYQPNFWLDVSIYTEKSTSDLGSSRIQIGYDLDRIFTFSLNSDRQYIGDTMKHTSESWYFTTKDCSIYLGDASSSQQDSLLFEVDGTQVLYHDTTYVFYDVDKDSGYVHF